LKRLFDLTAAIAALFILAFPILLVALAVRVSSPGPVVYWSDRVGRDNNMFRMPKFRTMRVGAPEFPTHLMRDPERWVTPIGSFLRRSSMDELPQLWSILRGEMSFVGPRPVLCSEQDLISLRTSLGLHRLTPGLTGWAQINGRDELTTPEKLRLDAEYLRRRSFWFDLAILFATIGKVITREGVSH